MKAALPPLLACLSYAVLNFSTNSLMVLQEKTKNPFFNRKNKINTIEFINDNGLLPGALRKCGKVRHHKCIIVLLQNIRQENTACIN